MVKDLNLDQVNSRRPDHLTVAGNFPFFTLDSEQDGPELWRSDGTEVGTVIVKNISPNLDPIYDFDFGAGSRHRRPAALSSEEGILNKPTTASLCAAKNRRGEPCAGYAINLCYNNLYLYFPAPERGSTI